MNKKGTQFNKLRKQLGTGQVPMFLPAVFLQDEYLTGAMDEDRRTPPSQEMWDARVRGSQQPTHLAPESLYESIEKEGVQHPVTVYTPETGQRIMGDGHHRVAVAADVSRRTGRPVEVGLVHSDTDHMASHQYWDDDYAFIVSRF